jgi:hypothetical protein
MNAAKQGECVKQRKILKPLRHGHFDFQIDFNCSRTCIEHQHDATREYHCETTQRRVLGVLAIKTAADQQSAFDIIWYQYHVYILR